MPANSGIQRRWQDAVTSQSRAALTDKTFVCRYQATGEADDFAETCVPPPTGILLLPRTLRKQQLGRECARELDRAFATRSIGFGASGSGRRN